MRRGQQGFALMAAIFILLVLAVLGTVMVRLAAEQSASGVLVLQSARAYQAARGGLEWGNQRVLVAGSCLNPYPGLVLDGFTVSVSCQPDPGNPYNEGAADYHVYQVTALAERGAFGTPDYVSRRLQARITDAP
jgi:MSHA biogenesis protein MshP